MKLGERTILMNELYALLQNISILKWKAYIKREYKKRSLDQMSVEQLRDFLTKVIYKNETIF